MTELVVSLTYEGEAYELDLQSITSDEFRAIKRATGVKAGEFLRCFLDNDVDGDALTGLLWIMRTRAGVPASFDGVAVLQLLMGLKVDVESDDAPKAEDTTPTNT